MEIKLDTQNNATEFVTYIGGDGYSAPLLVKSDGITQNYLYLHRDYQGSILAITNQAGTIVEKRLFDAWGSLINYYNANGAAYGSWGAFDRGYTGHEHLTSVSLINMNARLYDPKLHRFLQPDNYIQEPFNTQNYNRYGYCWNNPLKFTDPSGEWIHLLIGAVIGGVVNWATHGCQFNMEGLKAFGIGAGAGLIGAATGGAAFLAAGGGAAGAGGFLAGAVSGAVGAAYSQAFLSIGNHIAFGDPLMSGKEFITGIAFGAILGGSINGAVAKYNGNTFWKGTPPRITVEPISLPKIAGLEKTGNPEIKTGDYTFKSDVKLANTTTTTTGPTTEANITSKVTFTQNVDGNGYKIEGLELNNAKIPVGNQAEYMNAIGNNKPTMIDGINYSGHALDQMQGRGILSPSAVKDAIMNPMQILNGNTPNTFMHIGNNGLRVIINSAGKVITVY